MELVPITREQLKKINSRKADMTDEERVELDALNRSASAFSNHRELYEHVRKTGYQRGADPESLVRSFVGLTGWEKFDEYGRYEKDWSPKEYKERDFSAVGDGTFLGRAVAMGAASNLSPFEKLTKEFFGKAMTPEQAEEIVMGKLENLYSPGKNPVLEFAGWDRASQEEEAVGNENKRRKIDRQTRTPDGTNEPVLNMPGVDYSPFTKDQLDVDQADPKQVQKAVATEIQNRMEQSPGLIFQAAAEYLTPEQEIMASAVALATDPSHVWELYREKIEEMDLEQWGAFRSAVLALKPEFDRNFLERQAGVFGMAERRVRNAGRMLSNLGLDLITFADNEREISWEIDRKIPNAFDESGRLLPEHEEAARQIIRDATKVERFGRKGMSEAVEAYYFENLPEMYERAKKRDRQDMLEYGVRQMTGFTRYKDLGKFQEGLLAIEGITADMLGIAAVSAIPVVGKAAAMTMTFGSFQSEMEERLRFEHNVAPETARLISGVAAVPYALSEYYQVKHLNPATWGKGVNEGGMKLMTALQKPSSSQMVMHYFKEHFKRATWNELKEEYIQAGIQFAAMETARLFAQSEGIEFSDNLRELVQESIEATIYMPFVTMLGGASIGGFNAARTGDLSAMVAPEFKQAWHDKFIPADAWGNSQDARKLFNEMQQSGGLSIDRFPRELKRLVRRADSAADKMKFRGGAQDADGVIRDADGNIVQNQGGGNYILTPQNTKIEDWEALDREVKDAVRAAGYHDVNAALTAIRYEIESDNARIGLQNEEVSIYRDRLAGQLGQADETDVLTSPKLSLIESALDAYGTRLGVNLEVYATQQEAMDAHPELTAAKGNKIKASLLPDGRTVVVVEENIDNAADGAEQFYHEVFGHRGLDLNPKAQRLYDELKAAVDPDFIRSELPEFYRNMTDEAVMEEYLSRLTAKAARGQDLGSEQAKGVWARFGEWAGKELGLTPDAALRAQDVARLARDVLSFAKNHNALYPDGTAVKLNRKTYRRDGGRWVNEKGQAITDSGMVAEIEAAADTEIKQQEARDQKARKQQAEQRIKQMEDADPVVRMVMENGGVRMPELKPGESYPDEFAAIPERFRAKKGKGLSLDELADQVAALSAQEADYSTDELRTHLERFDAKAGQILQQAADKAVDGSLDEEARLIADLESGKISESEFNQAMAEISGARFSVEDRQSLKDKIERFKGEIDETVLNDEQRGIYDVVTGGKSSAEIRKSDLNDLEGFVLLHKGGRGKGANKIVRVHYGPESRNQVSAQEILDIGRVIRDGKYIEESGTKHPQSHRYELTSDDGARLRVVVDSDRKGKESVINFYSDRRPETRSGNTAQTRSMTDSQLDDTPEGGKSQDPKFSVAPSVDSPEFKAWFGDSKVVDADGKPLVVYHGAPDARFIDQDGTFKTVNERYGEQTPDKRAFWFASTKKTALSYADDRRAFDYQNAEPGVVEAYLSLKNPLIVEGGGKEWREAQARGKTGDVIDQARAGGHDGVIIRNVKDDYNNHAKTALTDTYVVFSSNQIKSVYNQGTWDANNPDIRFSVEQLGFNLAPAGDAAPVERRDLFGGAKPAPRQESLFGTQAAKVESAPGADLFSAEQRKAPLAKKKIQDFGEVIQGARKHYAEEYLSKAKQGELLDVAAEPLSKSWPEPNYQKLLEGGASPEVVAFIHAARDEVPNKPRSGYKLRRYVQAVELLRSVSNKLLTGEISAENMRFVLSRPEFSHASLNVGGRAELYARVGHAKSLSGVYLTSGTYSVFNGVPYSPAKVIWSVEKRGGNTQIGNWPRMLATGETRQAAVDAFAEAYEGFADSSPGRSTETKFDLYTKRGQKGVFIGKKIGRNYVDLEVLPDVAAARAYMKEHQADLVQKLEDYKQIPAERRAENSPRVGEDYRGGRDITPERFSEQFGFRGVQFGNYVEDDRRQADLNNAYDALMDLAVLLNIPPRAVSLNGELGLAFGARGKGGKEAPSAHYEPVQVVINLTKRAGPGSLAHEWWHALDNYFARMGGKRMGYLSDGAWGTDGVRPEMVQAFDKIRAAIRDSGLPARSKLLDARRSTPYWSEMIEMSARTFESFVKSRMDQTQMANDYLVNFKDLVDYIAQTFAAEEMYPYLTDAERGSVFAAFDGFFDTIESRETGRGTALFSVEQQTDPIQETAAHVAGRIFQGDFQFTRVTKGKRKGEMVERPEKEQIAEVEKLLKSQGESPKLAAQVLADAKEIALRVSKDRESLTNSRLLSKAIREEGLRQQFRSLVKHAYSKGQQGGEYFKAAQAHVEERIRQQAVAMQTQPGLLIEDLENEYGVKVKDLLDRLELEEKREKAKNKDQRPEVEGQPDAETLAGAPDLSPQEQEIYREPAEQYLHKIKSAVIRDLLKNKTIDDAGSFTKNMRNPIVRAAYAETLKHVLLKTSAELNYGFERDVIERGIREIGDAALLSTIDSRAERLIQRMFDSRVKETKEELYQRAEKALEGFKGKIKSRQQDISRKVTARAEMIFRHARKALLQTPEKAEARLMELHQLVNYHASRAYDGDPDSAVEFEAALDELNAYTRFAAFKFKTTAQMAEQLEWLEKTMTEEMEAQEERRAKARAEASGFRARLLAVLPNRKKGDDIGLIEKSNSSSQFLMMRLNGLARFGSDAERKAALKDLEDLAFEISRANTRKNNAVAEDNRALGQALKEIYGGNPGLILRTLLKPMEAYEQFSLHGHKLSKSQLIQMIGMLSQEQYRHAARVQAELVPLVAGREGTAAEIAKSLWQADEGTYIKFTTADGEGLSGGMLEHFVQTILDGAHLSKRLEMEKDMLAVLDPQDKKLLNWFREYYRRNRPVISDVNQKVTGLPILPPDINYIPAKVDFERGGFKGVNVTMPVVPPSLSPRVFNARDLDERADIVGLYMQRVGSNHQFVNFAPVNQRTAMVFNDAALLKKLRNTHGESTIKQLMVHLRDTISGQPITSGRNEVIDSIVNAMAATRLGFNMSLLPRQITSLPAFAMYVNTGDFFRYAGSAFSPEGIETMKKILASPHAKTRMRTGHTQVMNEFLSGFGEKGSTVWEAYKRGGAWPTKIGDIIPTLIFGQGYYRAMVDDAARQGMQEQEGHEWAMDQLWRLVEMSQQSGSMMNLAEWQRHGGSLGRGLGQFITSPQQYWAKEVFDWRDLKAAIEAEGWGSERTNKALQQFGKTSFINFVVLAGLYNGMKLAWYAMLGDWPEDDDWMELMASMLVGPMSGMFILGTAVEGIVAGAMTGKRGYSSQLIPMSGVFDDIQTVAAVFNHLFHGDVDEIMTDLDRLLKSNLPPYRDVRRAVENYGQ